MTTSTKCALEIYHFPIATYMYIIMQRRKSLTYPSNLWVLYIAIYCETFKTENNRGFVGFNVNS